MQYISKHRRGHPTEEQMFHKKDEDSGEKNFNLELDVPFRSSSQVTS